RVADPAVASASLGARTCVTGSPSARALLIRSSFNQREIPSGSVHPMRLTRHHEVKTGRAPAGALADGIE
ncbi:MAG TPA: hypothetical protein VIX82_10630, partial [Solirubrobacteraceae bacterium]